MDAYEATRIVFSRIQALDPENAAKIMGLLLIQDHGEKEMIRLAFGPETLLHSIILKAKKDLGLSPSPTSCAPPPIIPPSSLQQQQQQQQRQHNFASSGFGVAPPPLTIVSPSWAPTVDGIQCSSEELTSPVQFIDDFAELQQQLSFFNDPYVNGHVHRRSYSAAPDLCVANSPDGSGFGWKPCLYFARGFCKNGTSCRFLHGLPEDGNFGKLDAAIEQELMLRSKSQRLAFPYSPTPLSPSSSKCMNILLQQQQIESQRAAAAAAAAAMMLGGDESYKFMGRSRSDFMGIINPGSRQIYLTFPADSTFREEDVSNYFSIYGPVQDVRIPYQQKRMFGFVTFVYSETVKLILAKGNPHFVCDARVLVKPYKEKGKIPDKKQQGERGDAHFFSACTTPTGLDSRDPFDFQQLGPRMTYNHSSGGSQEMILRRKLEEQQQAAELQQAIEFQGRRFMGLQLLDFKNRSMSSSTTISSPATITTAPSHEGSPTEDKSPRPASSGGEQQVKAVVNAADKDESVPNEDSDFQESVEHNLPDSPFASPTKLASSLVDGPFSAPVPIESEFGNAINGHGNHHIGSTLLPPTSLDMAPFKSCFFQMPRFSSGHGAVGL